MTEQNSQIIHTPEVIIPPRPRPTRELELEAELAINYLENLTSSSRLDPELRMAFSDIKNTVKTLKNTVVRMTEEAEANHDRLVEVVRSQRLIS